MTESKRKKLRSIEHRLDDIMGEITGFSAVEYTRGKTGRTNDTSTYLDMANNNLEYALELIKRAERGKTN